MLDFEGSFVLTTFSPTWSTFIRLTQPSPITCLEVPFHSHELELTIGGEECDVHLWILLAFFIMVAYVDSGLSGVAFLFHLVNLSYLCIDAL